MDGRARAAQSVDMNATNAVRASERNLRTIIDTIAGLTCQPSPDAPSFNHDPTEQKLTRESPVTNDPAGGASVDGSLKHASVNRLACLCRHWTWADEALA